MRDDDDDDDSRSFVRSRVRRFFIRLSFSERPSSSSPPPMMVFFFLFFFPRVSLQRILVSSSSLCGLSLSPRDGTKTTTTTTTTNDDVNDVNDDVNDDRVLLLFRFCGKVSRSLLLSKSAALFEDSLFFFFFFQFFSDWIKKKQMSFFAPRRGRCARSSETRWRRDRPPRGRA